MRRRLTATESGASQLPLQPPAAPAAPAGATGLGRAVEQVVSLGGAAGLIGGLLYYFGWARSAALYGHFGIDVGMVGLTFQDYLLRSVTSTFWPLMTLGLVALAALGVDAVAVRSSHVRTAGLTAVAVGSLLLLAGGTAVVGWISFATAWPVVPVMMLTGLVLTCYGAVLAGRRRERRSAVPVRVRVPIALLMVMLTFWSVSGFASYRGTRSATAIAGALDARPGVVVFSAEPLDLRGEGVSENASAGAQSAYPYCYSGLRLLIESGGRSFLLPAKWQRGRDPVVVLAPAEGLRFEYFSPSASATCP